MRSNSIIFTAALAASCCASAWGGNSIEDTHIFRIGAYEQDIDVMGGVTREGEQGVDLDFDRVLGLEDSSTTFFFSYQWRFGEKWSLQALYSDMSSDGSKVATRDFTWNGQDYTAGLELDTDFNLDTYLVAVNYSFVRNERVEFGVGFGLHAFDIETDIDVKASIDNVTDTGGRNTSTLLAPLPNLRAYGTFMITPRWEVSASLGWLSFNYEDYDGSYLFLNASTEYRVTDKFGIGLSYQSAEIDIEHQSTHRTEDFNIDLLGPSLYLTYGF